jgi:TetR/AcrR family transcriptional regulator
MALWIRARQPVQKALRRQAILGAAAQLYEQVGFDGASMKAIAGRAKLSKANVYRYFRTKEELFLQLYIEDLTLWITTLEGALKKARAHHRSTKKIDWVAMTITQSIEAHPRMASMTPLLASTMERNLPRAVLLQFKRTIHQQIEHLACTLTQVVPGCSVQQGIFIVTAMAALLAGLWPMAHPAPELEAILAQEELKSLRLDFGRDLRRALAALLRGVRDEEMPVA